MIGNSNVYSERLQRPKKFSLKSMLYFLRVSRIELLNGVALAESFFSRFLRRDGCVKSFKVIFCSKNLGSIILVFI